MQKFIEEMINQFGYIAVAVLILAENLFPPIPSEIILTLGGFMVAKLKLNIIIMIIAATVGSLIGAIVLYWVGGVVNEDRLRVFLIKHYRYFRVKEKDLDLAFKLLKKHGKKLIFFGRMVPVVRSLISIPAGMIKMDKRIFVIYTTLGTLIWNSVLVSLGYVLGERWTEVVETLALYSTLVKWFVLFGVLGVIYIYIKRIFEKKKER